MRTTEFQFLIPNDKIPELDEIAEKRDQSGNNGGTGHYWDPQTHKTGVYSEYGFSQMPAFVGKYIFQPQIAGNALNAYRTRLDGDMGGKKAEVKGTWHRGGGLSAPRKKVDEYPDKLKMPLVTLDRVPGGILCTARGWMYAKELRDLEDNPLMTKAPAPLARQNELRPINTLDLDDA